MEICEHKHEEIVHNEKYCPLCMALSDISRLEDEVSELKDQIYNMEQK